MLLNTLVMYYTSFIRSSQRCIPLFESHKIQIAPLWIICHTHLNTLVFITLHSQEHLNDVFLCLKVIRNKLCHCEYVVTYLNTLVTYYTSFTTPSQHVFLCLDVIRYKLSPGWRMLRLFSSLITHINCFSTNNLTY